MAAINDVDQGLLFPVFLCVFILLFISRIAVIILARRRRAMKGPVADAAKLDFIPINSPSELFIFFRTFFRIFAEEKLSLIGFFSLLSLISWGLIIIGLVAVAAFSLGK